MWWGVSGGGGDSYFIFSTITQMAGIIFFLIELLPWSNF